MSARPPHQPPQDDRRLWRGRQRALFLAACGQATSGIEAAGLGALSRIVLASLVAVLALFSVAGCGLRPSGLGGGWLGGGTADGDKLKASNESTSAVRPQPASRVSIAASKPFDAYVLLGGRVKSCWFNAVDPLLPDHVYRADVSPEGDKVQITVHQKQALGRPGRQPTPSTSSRKELTR